MRKNYSVYVHKVNTPEGPMYYTGVTGNIDNRWQPRQYKTTALWPYIEKYGWDNIEHIIVFESNNRNKAYEIEDLMILFYHSICKCINKRRSGHIKATDKKAYNRMLIKELRRSSEYRERERKYAKKYAKIRLELCKKRQKDKYANDPEWVERHREAVRKNIQTPEGKVYNRVSSFNQRHPDSIIETPLEAKRKYIESGGTIIPQYIKYDDL